MRVGFSGTSRGMTGLQQAQVRAVLMALQATELHHGDCVGADAEAHEIAQMLAVPVEIHPPENERMRAWCQGARKVHPPRPYIIRNHDIVAATQVLVATPRTREEQLRSGTWATVRHARKMQRLICIVHPDGHRRVESPS